MTPGERDPQTIAGEVGTILLHHQTASRPLWAGATTPRPPRRPGPDPAPGEEARPATTTLMNERGRPNGKRRRLPRRLPRNSGSARRRNASARRRRRSARRRRARDTREKSTRGCSQNSSLYFWRRARRRNHRGDWRIHHRAPILRRIRGKTLIRRGERTRERTTQSGRSRRRRASERNRRRWERVLGLGIHGR